MITSEEFVRLANRLALAASAGEVEWRTAVSRAYYGAFHLASALLESAGGSVPDNPTAHAFVQRRLMECGQEDARQAGSLLKDLHSERRKADYKLKNAKAGTKEFALYSLETAERFCSALAACASAPNLSRIKVGIEEYERKLDGGR
ncbi:MAG TPA: HEPN domain-containing protein [Pirellulales bacterium]|nr:HEPN domain-containing protein [Pirellulales bacterium]